VVALRRADVIGQRLQKGGITTRRLVAMPAVAEQLDEAGGGLAYCFGSPTSASMQTGPVLSLGLGEQAREPALGLLDGSVGTEVSLPVSHVFSNYKASAGHGWILQTGATSFGGSVMQLEPSPSTVGERSWDQALFRETERARRALMRLQDCGRDAAVRRYAERVLVAMRPAGAAVDASTLPAMVAGMVGAFALFLMEVRSPAMRQMLEALDRDDPEPSALPSNSGAEAPPFDVSFQNYLDRLQATERVPAVQVEIGRRIWASLRAALGGTFPMPVAGPTEDGALELSWTRKRRHVSVEVYPEGWEWFFRDRETDVIDGGDVVDHETVPEALVARLASLL
jgi:hypothetical protein